MKPAKPRLLLTFLFIGIFFIKMAISIAPVFLLMNSKTVNSVIMQLEQESKEEKDAAEKDLLKDKKFVDEDMVLHCYELPVTLIETNILHNQEHALFKQVYHPVVPTPPPNV